MSKKTSPSGELSARQVAILDFIKTSTESQGYAPSMREIADGAGLASPASVKYQLDILEEKGFIRRDVQPRPRHGGRPPRFNGRCLSPNR